MGTKLSRQDLTDRLNHAVSTNYLNLASIIGGVNLAVAADSLVRFVTAPVFPWDRLPLWIFALESLYIAYGALTLAPLVAIYRPNWRDNFFPLLIGLTVLLLFEMSPNPDLVIYWYLVAAITAYSRFALSAYVASQMKQVECEDDVRQVVQDYGRSMSRFSYIHLAFAACLLIAFVALLLIPSFRPWHWVVAVLGSIVLLVQIVLTERARGHLVSALR